MSEREGEEVKTLIHWLSKFSNVRREGEERGMRMVRKKGDRTGERK